MVDVTTQPEPAQPDGHADSGALSDGGTDEPPAPEPEPPEPALSVAAVARRLGIAPATLRTWDRRYGVGPRGHATGRHRRYGSQDVARLELMQRALLRGASPAEAARYALTTMLLPGYAAEPASAASGGRVLRLAGASQVARGLGRAVLAMDSVAAQRLLGEAIEASGVPRVWDDVMQPVLAAIAQRWPQSGAAETEHLLYECVLAALIRATPLVGNPRNPRPVLLACAPGELHTLPLHGLDATLACRGLGTRMLGPDVPADVLTAAIRRTSPAAVVLWAQQPHNADPALVAAPKVRQRTRLFLGGPGWRAVDVDPRSALPDGIGPAADDIENAVL
jgi:MerR family transcriptional regulator, light-induced transcriptional regulator